MSSIRNKFVKDFSEDTARNIELAAESHSNGVNSANKGSDPFKWALCICIGYECFEKDHFRECHDIDPKHTYKKISSWIKKNGKLDTHDGDFDYLAMFVGAYNKYMPKKSKTKKKK